MERRERENLLIIKEIPCTMKLHKTCVMTTKASFTCKKMQSVNCSGLTEGGGRDEENVLEKDEIEESV